MPSKKVVVIGAGVGGLSAAALLAKNGFEVEVIEKTGAPGGRARVWKKDGFVYDMGPSWYLMPEIFENFFNEFNKSVADYYKLLRLDPNYRIFFDSNDIVEITADLDTNLETFERLETGGAAKLQEYLDKAEETYEYMMKGIMYEDLSSIWTMFSPKLMRAGSKLHIFSNIDKWVRKFFSSDRARKILEYPIVFLGGNPKNTPALYSIISHIDYNLGVWYPLGGLGMIPEALLQLSAAHGATVRFGVEATQIDVVDRHAKTVQTTQGPIDADLVVVNADYPFAETQLLERKYQTYPSTYWEKKIIAPSAFVLYLGFDMKLDQLTHHNVFLEYDWVQHFDQIFEAPAWPDKPAYYVCCPSRFDDSVAPKGKENIFVTVPISPGIEDTPQLREAYFDKILSHMEKLMGESLRDSMVVKRIFSLNDFAQDYNAYKGTAVGLTHTFRQSAFFRPRHKSKKVKNLYYSGQYTHPGIGVPMALVSSQIVAEQITSKHG
ncbi:MAG: phytoene desaturase family protein [Candidatus Hermodarchaeota archaeon]|nr:phytoene desaturase family protein [Candidatus Hermodarchaeota archaeon]